MLSQCLDSVKEVLRRCEEIDNILAGFVQVLTAIKYFNHFSSVLHSANFASNSAAYYRTLSTYLPKTKRKVRKVPREVRKVLQIWSYAKT